MTAVFSPEQELLPGFMDPGLNVASQAEAVMAPQLEIGEKTRRAGAVHLILALGAVSRANQAAGYPRAAESANPTTAERVRRHGGAHLAGHVAGNAHKAEALIGLARREFYAVSGEQSDGEPDPNNAVEIRFKSFLETYGQTGRKAARSRQIAKRALAKHVGIDLKSIR